MTSTEIIISIFTMYLYFAIMQLSYARVKRNDTAGTSICPFRLVVRTLLFQGKNTGSIPVGDVLSLVRGYSSIPE